MPSLGPKIVILLATRNGARFLREQLESYRAQTYQNWELQVSDDGSTDQTVAIIDAFSKTIVQRVVLREGPQLGFWQNFVTLVRREDAEGDFFAYSDQDDIWLPDKLARAAAWLEMQTPEIPALYFSRTELIELDGTPAGCSPLFMRPPSFRNALVQNIGGGNTMVFNRAARQALLATPRDAELASHDWWTYQVVTGVGGVAHYDPQPSLKYRQHEQNLVGSNVGYRAQFIRVMAFARGQVAFWNDINLKFLGGMKGVLTAENARVLELYTQARHAAAPFRPWLIWESGVYRQGLVENIGLWAGAFFGKI